MSLMMISRYAPEGKPMYQIVEELAEDNEYFAQVPPLNDNRKSSLFRTLVKIFVWLNLIVNC